MVASIAYIERIIGYFERAVEANLETPGRAGNLVELTPELADEVIITGDLHGHRRNFNLIKRAAALDKNPRRHLILQEVCHGGPTYSENGGCMSHTVLEDVARLKTEFPGRVHFILGNHELAELADYPIQKNRQMLNLLFRLGLQQMYGPATDRVREAMLVFLRSSPLAVRLPHGVFVSHSIPERCDERPFNTSLFTRELEEIDFVERAGIFDLVWGRDYREENAQAFANLVGARILVNGHEPCPQGFNAPNKIQVIVDCCSSAASYLTLPTDRELTHAEIVERVTRLA